MLLFLFFEIHYSEKSCLETQTFCIASQNLQLLPFIYFTKKITIIILMWCWLFQELVCLWQILYQRLRWHSLTSSTHSHLHMTVWFVKCFLFDFDLNFVVMFSCKLVAAILQQMETFWGEIVLRWCSKKKNLFGLCMSSNTSPNECRSSLPNNCIIKFSDEPVFLSLIAA